MVTKVNSSNFSSAINATITAVTSLPTVASVQATDSSYSPLSANYLDTTSTAYIKITGTNFFAGSQVFIEGQLASSITYVSSTQLNVVLPSKSSGTYVLYVVNPDGSVAIRINAVTYSISPVWSTGSTLAGVNNGTAVSIQLSATSDSSIVYTVTSGTLPPGLSLSSSGLLSGTVEGVSTETTYNFTVTATDTENQINPSSFSINITVGDPYFNYTTLLLNGETTVTPFIKDASTNNFGLTVTGDTRPDKFSPYYGDGYYSNYFDGTGDYLSYTGTNILPTGTENFTVEMWINRDKAFSTGGDLVTTAATSSGFNLYINTTAGTIRLSTYNVAAIIEYSYTSLSIGIWYHLAIVRSGNNFAMFINGIRVATATSSGSFVDPSTSYIGSTSFSGYISNLRVVRGTSIYDGTLTTITVPTTPLTAVAGTSLLTCQSNRFIDNSTNNFAITKNGDVTVSSAIPFAANSSYSTYGSAYFDGTSDAITTTNNAYLAFGSEDFTIECWAYLTGTNGGFHPFTRADDSSSTNLEFGQDTSVNQLKFQSRTAGIIAVSYTFPLNQWVHVAATRTGTNLRLFANGVPLGSGPTTDSTVWTAPSLNRIGGSSYSATHSVLGYLSDMRIIKGTAIYTSAFTPPTQPLTAVANTQLLTLQYNGGATNNGFVDTSSFNNVLTRYGNTTQGTFSPYSQTGWSTYFNGTSGLQTPASSLTNIIGSSGLITSTFTIDCWIYPTSRSGSTDGSLVGDMAPASGSNNWSWGPRNDGKLNFNWYTGSTNNCTGSSTIALNTWTHIALVISTTTIKMFVNGVQETLTGTTTLTAPSSSLGYLGVGMWNNGAGGNNTYFGHVSNLRIVKSALYSSTFTPSATPLTATANTSLLTCQSSMFIDNSPNVYPLAVSGTPSVQAISPFGSSTTLPTTYSNYFDGTGDYLGFPSTPAIRLGTSDFTIEAWVYITGSTASRTFCSHYTGGTDFIFGVWSGQLSWLVGGSITLPFGALLLAGAWYHVAAVRDSGILKLFVNGVASATSIADSNNYAATGNVFIGYADRAPAIAIYAGWISNLRITKAAVYTTAFTPSTTPLTALSNTQLLTCQSNVMQDNSVNKFVLTATGDVKPKEFNPFGYTNTSASYTPSLHSGSAYFDGTGDFLSIPPSTAFTFSGDFTIEAWVYPTVINADNCIISRWTSSLSFIFKIVAAGRPYLAWYKGGSGTVTGTTTAVRINQWNHVAVTRIGSTVRLFVNGVQDATTGTIAGAFDNSSTVITVGSLDNGPSQLWNGYLSDIRVINGTALYSASFIPPTATLPNTTSSTLLLNFTNGGIVDQHSTNVVETIGNAQISTQVKKYGNASISFSGSGQYLNIPSGNPLLQLLTGDFTVEFWMYGNSVSTACALVDNRNPDTANIGFDISLTSSVLRFTTSGTAFITGTTTLSNGVWYHVALTRSSNTFKMFLNGAQEGTTYTGSSTQNFTNNNVRIGSGANGAFNGYIDDLRITKGYARYTSNFTVPAALLAR